MKPPVPYFGGKSRLAPWIVEQFPEHKVYVEPFCGSAAVLLAKPPSKIEIANDADGNLINFFRVLRDEPDRLARVCMLTPYSREEFLSCRSPDPEADDVERARRWFCHISQGFGALSAPNVGWSAPSVAGGNEAAKVRNLIDRFHMVAERLIGVHFESRDGLDLIRIHDSVDTLFYIDPPYLWSTRSWAKVQKSKRDYNIEFQTDAQHRELAAALTGLQGTVVLSGYPSELYGELFANGWWTVERDVAVLGRKRLNAGRSRASEVLWTNRDPSERGRLGLTAG